MANVRRGIGRDVVLMSGLVVVLGGVAAFGVFLVAAGEELAAQAVLLGSGAAACFAIGFVVLTRAAKRRGGMLSAEPTAAQRRAYRSRHRSRVRPKDQSTRYFSISAARSRRP